MIPNSGKHPCGCPLCYEMQEFQSHRRQECNESRWEQMSWLIALDLAENSQGTRIRVGRNWPGIVVGEPYNPDTFIRFMDEEEKEYEFTIRKNNS